MNSRNKLFCILLFYLFGMINLGDAVKCFSCSSAHNYQCGDDFKRRLFKAYECLGSCVKTRGRDSENQLEINRFCRAAEDDSCFGSTYNDISVERCVCNTDFCNPASKLFPTSGVLFTSLLTFLIVCFL